MRIHIEFFRQVLTIVAVLIGSLSQSLFATMIATGKVDCPVCGESVVSSEVVSTNTFGGTDSDFCMHASGSNIFSSIVWTCGNCYYSNYGSVFTDGVKKSTKERILKELKSKIAEEPSERINGEKWFNGITKYELAAIVSEWDGAGNTTLADLYLKGSWCARQDYPGKFDSEYQEEYKEQISLVYDKIINLFYSGQDKDPRRLNRSAEILLIAMAGMDGITNGAFRAQEVPLVQYFSACQYRSRGANTEAIKILDLLNGAKDTPVLMKKAISEVQTLIDSERRFQKLAIEYMEKAITAEEYEDENVSTMLYLVGELYRRIGNNEKASEWFNQLKDHPTTTGYRLMVQWLSPEILRNYGIDINKLPEPEKQFTPGDIATLIETMKKDKRKGQIAAETLTRLAKKNEIVMKALVEAMNNPSDYPHGVIRSIIDAINDYDTLIACLDKSDGWLERIRLVDRIVELDKTRAKVYLLKMLGSDNSLDRETAAEALVMLDDKTTVPALVKALEAETDHSIRSGLIDVLGKTNDKRAVPILIELFERSIVYAKESARMPALPAKLDKPRPTPVSDRYAKGANRTCEKCISNIRYLTLLPIPGKEKDLSIEGQLASMKVPGLPGSSKVKKDQGLPGIYKKGLKNTLAVIKEWWERNKNGTREQWLITGFKDAGYNVEDLKGQSSIPEYIRALDDDRVSIRNNAIRQLKKLSGQDYPTNDWGKIRWAHWWKEEGSKKE